MPPDLIINADDFGLDSNRNSAIVSCLVTGWCSSATLMANMPGFQEACDLVKEHGFQDRIGVHLNLTEGMALTESLRKCPRCCRANGLMAFNRSRRYWRLNRPEREAVAEEIRAQIRRCRAEGVPLTHADSHNHVHEEPAILPIVIQVLRQERIPFLRITRNIGIQRSPLNAFYRYLGNVWIGRAGLRRTQCFGKADDYGYELNRNSRRVDSCEVMIHPTHDATGRLVDSYLGMPIEECVKMWAGKRLSSYGPTISTANS